MQRRRLSARPGPLLIACAAALFVFWAPEVRAQQRIERPAVQPGLSADGLPGGPAGASQGASPGTVADEYVLAARHSPVPPNLSASSDAAALDLLGYRYIGPTRGGRVTAVAGHAGQPNTFYFGGVGGGVFRTDDAGGTWVPVSDGQIPVGSIGAIKVAPSDTAVLYVGTGSAAIRSNVSIGRGVYKSVDAGRTWHAAGLEKAGVIADMVVHPTNADIAYVAAVGNPFGPNPERGIFRTQDGGMSWQRVLFVSDSTGASDIAMNPHNPDELYAGMWRAERKPWTIISGARREGGIYKSTDGGSTWRKLANGLPREYTGKISVSVSQANPQRVYALLEAGDGTLGIPGGAHGGVYRSDDAGATWTRTSSQAGLVNRPFYYIYIDADPKDADVVYVNNESFFKSTDGGVTFTRMPTPHVDNHGMWINPDDPDIFIQSNDGGVNVTKDGGRTWSTQNNQPTAELYQVDLDDRWPYWVYAGQQDNTTIGVPSTGEGARPNATTAWRTNVGGCETGPAVPQPGTDGQVFFSNCKGRFYRYSEITRQSTEYSVGASNMYGHNPRDLRYRFQRVAPIVISPHDADVVYHASQYLHRTVDGGRTWETLSPDLTANDPRGHVVSGSPITRDITGEEFYSTLYAVAESPLERGVIWTGANDGPVHVTRNNGRTWSSVTPRGLPAGGRVQTLEASPHRQGSAYVAVLRYMFDDWKPYIYRTDDYGASWTLLTGPDSGFPQDHPTRVVREDPDRAGLLYAGTEFGVFISFDNGATWRSFQRNLPHTPVMDMKLYRGDLVLATQGRGFWIVDNLSPLHGAGMSGESGGVHLFAPRVAYRGLRGEAVIDYHLLHAARGPITLEILDGRGDVVRAFTTSATAEGTAAPAAGRQSGAGSSGSAGSAGGAGGVETRLSAEVGVTRFSWDLRRAGAGGRGMGPFVVPGHYTVRLGVPGAAPVTTRLDVQLDPRLAADGITVEDLEAQHDLVLRIAALAADAQQLQNDLRAARQRLEQGGRAATLRQVSALEQRLVTQGGQAYAQPMLLAQISYLNGIVSRGDNRPHRDAFERYAELRSELDGMRAELQRIGD
jgi:photosystem II stability/assembly factor-like uncharacterized protein